MRVLVLWLALAGAVWATPFTERALAHFDSWDADQDGKLQLTEIQAAMRDPQIRGEDAAALVVLYDYARPTKKRRALVWTRRWLDSYAGAVAHHRKPRFNFDADFRRRRKLLDHACRDLFAPGGPHLEAIAQGPQGDCYFLGPVGGMVNTRPDELRRLVARTEGGYVVRLPGWHNVVEPEPTDAEIAAFSQDTTDGLWLMLLERAVGKYRQGRSVAVALEPAELAGHGGHTMPIIHALTGHKTASYSFRDKDSTEAKAEAPDRVRQILTAAVADGRVVTLIIGRAGNPPDPLPRGIPHSHIMAVLGYDQATDQVKVWNPWGNTIAPRPGEAAFETHHGVFFVTVPQLVRNFAFLAYEAER